MIFSLDDLVLEHGSRSSVFYCVKDDVLFKCSGGFKDYKKRQFVSKNVKKLDFVDSGCKASVKLLALSLNIPVYGYRKIKRIEAGLL